MNSTRPKPVGEPAPSSPKRRNQATKEMSITFLMPKRFRQKGISRMQRVSETWEIDERNTLFFTAKAFAYSGSLPKSSRYGVAKPLVTWRHMPSRKEKMKKMHIFGSLNSVKARRPKASTSEEDFFSRLTGQFGRVKA